MQRCGDEYGHGCNQTSQRRRRAPPEPQQPQPQWYTIGGHIVFAVSFSSNASPDNPDMPPGLVVSQEDASFDRAANRVRLRCYPNSDCQIFFTASNMCAAAAQGFLRNGRGTRIYPSAGSPIYNETQAAERALAYCRADNAVSPESCTVVEARCGESRSVYE